MKLIGYWITSLKDEKYLPPQEFVKPYTGEDKKVVVDYLTHGEVFETYRGISWCRFCCGHPMGNREFSDGYWVWPEDLVHYVRDHSVMLPQEFIDHVRMGLPRIPKTQWVERVAADDFWIDWCHTHSNGIYQEKLAVASQLADQESTKRFSEAVRALELEKGLSAERCLWQGCHNLALKGQTQCAYCILRESKPGVNTSVYTNLEKILTE